MRENNLKVGILTVSDRASAGIYEDKSGIAIEDYLNKSIADDWVKKYKLVPDSYDEIKKGIISLADKYACSIVITTGGTGPSPRDITPEATTAACSRMLPGFGELMRAESLKFVRTAILSRQTAGIRGETLIINLPGKPKAINQCLDAIFPAIPDCVKLIGGPTINCTDSAIKIHHP